MALNWDFWDQFRKFKKDHHFKKLYKPNKKICTQKIPSFSSIMYVRISARVNYLEARPGADPVLSKGVVKLSIKQ